MAKIKQRIYEVVGFLFIMLFLTMCAIGYDSGLWNDDTVTGVITQTTLTHDVCIGTTCDSGIKLSIDGNATIDGSRVCTAGNGACQPNGSQGWALVYGELWQHTDASDGYQTVMGTTSRPLSNLSAGQMNGMTNSSGGNGTNNLIIQHTGTYKINWHVSFTGSVSEVYQVTVMANSVELPDCEAHRKLGTSLDVGSASGTCIAVLNSEWPVTLVGHRESAPPPPGQVMEAFTANLNVVMIGP